MTQDETLKLARKYAVGGLEFDVEGLERFVNDVRADEREACAKACEEMKGQCWAYDHDTIAAAIRARGQE